MNSKKILKIVIFFFFFFESIKNKKVEKINLF